MIGAIAILVILLAFPTHEQDAPKSPCPTVFEYDPAGSKPGQWYAVINVNTDSTLHSLWLNIVLDRKVDLLGSWLGHVTTSDNTDFRVENTTIKIHPDKPLAVRFFVRFDPLVKVPRLHAIRLNGREICNADRPEPTNDGPGDSILNRPNINVERKTPKPEWAVQSKPTGSKPNTGQQYTRPTNSNKKPIYSEAADKGPIYIPTPRPHEQNVVNPYSIGGGQVPIQKLTPHPQYQSVTTQRTTTRKPSPSDFFPGGGLIFIVPSSSGSNSGGNTGTSNRHTPQNEQCGKVVKSHPNPLVINGERTLPGQWPWQVALYQAQTVDSKYICGGTLVSTQHVITVAHCVTLKGSKVLVNKNTLLVYLGKHNLRTSVEGVQIRNVNNIVVHPEYNPSIFSKDLSILTLREPVKYTEFVRAACLWPENLSSLDSVIGKIGSVVGWGFNDKGTASEELMLVTMPVVDQLTCVRSYSEFFARFTSDYTYCAGYRDGTTVCNGDSGGGMVFNIDGAWYLRGLVSLTVVRSNENRCDPSHYVVFTDIGTLLPWIQEQIRY
ncbi:uncharacterized protein [Epargyreus clarus]|uniref:uncharacterized protein isoform X2 n=1 Tax=Epargyreus clarus TaxID=520877 RepID=UPI003C2B831A